MRILLFGNSERQLLLLQKQLRKLVPEAELVLCRDTEAYFSKDTEANAPDLCFVPPAVPESRFFAYACRLREQNPKVNLVVCAEDWRFLKQAFEVYASDYLVWPVNERRLKQTLANLRHPVCERLSERVRVRCFGTFEVFFDGPPVHFKRSKAKKLFAYLVDRHGAMVTNEAAVELLWPDESVSESRKSMARTVFSEIWSTFSALSATGILERGKGALAIRPEQVSCDYYRFLAGDKKAQREYMGEYLTQYSFAEETRAFLQFKVMGNRT